jgi:hypothetical protein
MNLEKVVFGFFVLLAATLNFGFFIGDIDDPSCTTPSSCSRRGGASSYPFECRWSTERAQQRRTAPEDPRG